MVFVSLEPICGVSLRTRIGLCGHFSTNSGTAEVDPVYQRPLIDTYSAGRSCCSTCSFHDDVMISMVNFTSLACRKTDICQLVVPAGMVQWSNMPCRAT